MYSSGALDSFGTDDTPIDWPTTGAKIKAIEVEVTATDAFTGDGQIQTVVCQPGNLTAPISGSTSDASGTWSGWQGVVGTYRTSGVDAFYFNKIGGWRTEYLSFGTSGGTAVRLESTSTATPTSGLDIRARCRKSDWDDGYGVLCSTGTALGQYFTRVQFTAGDVRFTPHNSDGIATAPWSAFSETDGQWHAFRFVHDGTDAYFYENSAGDAEGPWTLVHTAALASTDGPSTSLHIGATNVNGSGFNGDVSDLEVRDGSGALIHSLNLDAMDAAADTGWSSATNSIYRDASGNTATGATIPATKRVRVDLDTPCPLADFRLIVDAQTGALTVDEILLEAECGGGVHLGLAI